MGKREKLIESGRSFFGEKGYLETSIEDITIGSGVAKGTFYNYFRSKEDLLVYILNEDVRSRLEKFEKIISFDLPLRKKFHYIAREYIKDLTDCPEMSMFRAKVHFSDKSEKSKEVKALNVNLCHTSTECFEELLEMHRDELKEIFRDKIKLSARILVNSLRIFIYTLLTGEEYSGQVELQPKDQLEKNIKGFSQEEVVELLCHATIEGFLK